MNKALMVIAGTVRNLFPRFTFIVILILSNYLAAFSWPIDSAYLNIKINNDTTVELQNEEQIIMNPKDTTNLVAVWRDFRLGYRQVGCGYSFDGGLTWNQNLFVDPYYPYDSDPGITVDTAGNFYAQILGYTGSTQDTNGLIVYKSTDGGMTWSEPVPAVSGEPDVFEDKGLITCDRSGGPYTDNLYVSWTRMGSTNDIVMVRSTDGGNSFEAPVAISDAPGAQWSLPCVGPNSEVCVAWYQYSQGEIRIDYSTDGGQSFGSDFTIQPLYFGDDFINGDIWVIAYPAIDIDITGGPYNGYIYVAYLEYSPGFIDTDIYFTRSIDGGQTWSQKVRINDDPVDNGCDQFHPWLTVAPDGSIIVVFLDRRLDPNNLLMDCYMTTSVDAGSTWSANERITTVSSDPTAGSQMKAMRRPPSEFPRKIHQPMLLADRAGLLGEYIGVTASSVKDIHPIWTDTRFGNQDVFVGVTDTAGTFTHEYAAQESNTLRLLITPNPFSNLTNINFGIEHRAQSIELTIFDATGRLVKSFCPVPNALGSVQISWDGTDNANHHLPSGVYFLECRVADCTATEKVLLIR